MLDQKKRFSNAGIRAEFVGSTQQDDSAIDDVLHGQVQLLYISPESLLNNGIFRAMLQSKVYKKNLISLVIDEAHCVKLWYVYYDCTKHDQIKIFYRGDVFRKAFAEIGNLRSILPYNMNVMATATKQMVECVIERLCMKEPAIIGANTC